MTLFMNSQSELLGRQFPSAESGFGHTQCVFCRFAVCVLVPLGRLASSLLGSEVFGHILGP